MVLLEVAANLWGSNPANLISAVRRAAPKAAVVFVIWPAQWMLLPRIDRRMRRKGKLDPAVVAITKAAHAHGAAVLDLSILLASLSHNGVRLTAHTRIPISASQSWCHNAKALAVRAQITQVRPRSLYARRGYDTVHPNAVGHALLGFMAAKLVALGACQPFGGSDSRSQPMPLAVLPAEAWERCYAAEELPVHTRSSAKTWVADLRRRVPLARHELHLHATSHHVSNCRRTCIFTCA